MELVILFMFFLMGVWVGNEVNKHQGLNFWEKFKNYMAQADT